MSKELTKKQKDFADDYLETGNGVQSVLKNYNTKNYNTAGVLAHENLKKPNIQKYLEDNAEMAVSNIIVLANTAENEAVRLSANKDILDRAGLKAVDRSVSVNINADITDPEALSIAQEYEQRLKKGL